MTVCDAAKYFKFPKSTLRDFTKAKSSISTKLEPLVQSRPPLACPNNPEFKTSSHKPWKPEKNDKYKFIWHKNPINIPERNFP